MKKLFISADLEGVSGVSSWEETRFGGQGYDAACRQLTREVAAACHAAQELGYTVLVKDGHEDARNIDPTGLPRGVLLHRGWQNEPAAMMCGLDPSYDAAIYIGYHAPEGCDGSPLAHTIEHPLYAWMKLDGELASEFSMNALWAAALGVPSVFLSGDRYICDAAAALCPGIGTYAAKDCTGSAVWGPHPDEVVEGIYAGVLAALAKPHDIVPLKDSYTLEICFREHRMARRASWYPGAVRTGAYTVAYTAKDPIELMTARSFLEG